MQRFFGILLLIAAPILLIGSFLAFFYLLELACGMNTTGCHQATGQLYAEAITSGAIAILLVPMALAAALGALGWWLLRRSAADSIPVRTAEPPVRH
ncbi:hypothetical protein FNJ84_03390 [Paracoccus sp. M683]|uniref:hypothetical protein n=1 Tax=Paracoccus sp. M683 TaxID=2594268 RepID=UPI00117EC4D6|nr:hypothetical protein [Paracoccus sp. M683]TRW98615.1 hypothetical protein FNJ84_03390 [Paracoccus sp. M683]